MAPVELLSIGATLALNAGFAWLAGSLLTRIWLSGAPASLLEQCARRLRLGEIVAALVCLVGSLLEIATDTIMMVDAHWTKGLTMLPDVLTQTGFGHSALAAMALAALLLVTPRRRWWPMRAALLLAFALARASMSHAAEHGLLSASVAIECLHLVLIGVWLGAVALSGWIVLPQAVRERGPLWPYLSQLSRGATIALGGIVATGVFNTWQRIDSPNQFVDSDYGVALTFKLALFGIAVLLGAYNRYVGFPKLARNDGGRALMVLRVESMVLLSALAAAAVLSSQAPPG